jgi:WD40 repeat protein
MEGSAVQAIAFSPSGDQIAWSTDSGTLWLARLDGSIPPLKLPAAHTKHVWELDFSPDGASLVSGGSDGKVLLWSTADGTLARTLRESGPAISTVRFSGGGKLVAAGGGSDQIEVWDVTQPPGQELVKQLPAVGGANRLGFNRDGTILGFGSDARYISMWSTSNWDKIFQLNALVGVRSIFDVHPSRGDLAFDGEDGVIRILPRHDQGNLAPPGAELRGMDVFFDDLPVNFGTDQDTVTVRAASPSCAMPGN